MGAGRGTPIVLRAALAAAITAIPLAARAEPPMKRTLRVELGLGTALDNVYLVHAWRARPGVQLDVGVGAGLLGVDVNVTPRFVLLDGRTRVLAGVGGAVSVASSDSSLDGDIPILWLTVDVALTRRLTGTWFVSLSAGATVWMSAPAEGCGCWFEDPHKTVPIGTLGVGHAL